MTKRSRVAAAALAAVAVAVLLISSVFIIEHVDHDCIGEDCPVCERLCVCAQTLKQLSAAVIAAAIVVTLAFSARDGLKRVAPAYAPRTPVLLKVKLSN